MPLLGTGVLVLVAGHVSSQDGSTAPALVSAADLETAKGLVRAIESLESTGVLPPKDRGAPAALHNYLPTEAQRFLDQLEALESAATSSSQVVALRGPEAPELLRTAYRLGAALAESEKPYHDCPPNDEPQSATCSAFSPNIHAELAARVASLEAVARRVARDISVFGAPVEDLTDEGVMRTVTLLFEQSLRADTKPPYASSLAEVDREDLRRKLYALELLTRTDDVPVGRVDEFTDLVDTVKQQAGIGEETRAMMLVHLEFLRARGALQSAC